MTLVDKMLIQSVSLLSIKILYWLICNEIKVAEAEYCQCACWHCRRAVGRMLRWFSGDKSGFVFLNKIIARIKKKKRKKKKEKRRKKKK